MKLTPIIDQQDVFLDINLQPLVNGKVELLDPVSSNLIDVYAYTDDEYVVTANPVILDIEGRSEQTIFSDRLTYVRVYAYKGLDENRHPIYEFIRDYYAGEDAPEESREYVIGMEALRDLDPSINSSVNIIGYFNAWDCPLRTYVWDETCSQDVDNGYIVGSDVSQTGRWVLVFDGEYIPSSYYGVMPGSEGNIQALMGYPDKVGSNQKPTAPGIWFVPGNYVTSISTLKNLQIDAKCQFDGIVDCNRVEVVGKANHYIGEIYMNGGVAHSSWFKSARVFLTCGADEMVIDPDSYFVNKSVTNSVDLTGKTLRGNNRLDVNFNQGGCYTVNDTTVLIGTVFDPRKDKVIFNTSKYGDGNFVTVKSTEWDPGSISSGHKVQYSSSSLPEVRKFDNVAIWGAIMVEMRNRLPVQIFSLQVLDFEGTDVPEAETIYTGTYQEVRNLNCVHLNCYNPLGSLRLYNIHATDVNVDLSALEVHDSTITFQLFNDTAVLGLYLYDSDILFWQKIANPNIGINARNCTIQGTIDAVHDNETNDCHYSFDNCTFAANATIKSKMLTMIDCVTRNNTIKVYPYKVDNEYRMYAVLCGNTFANNQPIEFTKLDSADPNSNCYDCVCTWTITNNTFTGNTEGLRCRYWQNVHGSEPTRVFIKEAFQVHSIVYKNNSGNCPWEDPKAYPSVSYLTTYTTHTTSGGTTYYIYYGTALDRKRIMSPGMIAGGDWSTNYITPTRGYVCKTSVSDERDLRWIGNTWLAHYAHLQYDDNGDFFELCPSMTHQLDSGDLEYLLFV